MSNIILHVEPNVAPLSKKQFLKKAPRRSVALDGYVADSTFFCHKTIKQNFNHHEKVDRLSTRSTCSQVLNAVRLGFFEQYRDEKGNIEMNVYVNDCDEDVCLSWFILKHGFLTGNVINPNLNKLVNCEDALDTTSGAYPFPKDLPLLGEMAWVFEPYRRARTHGLLNSKDPEVYRGIIEDVCSRIMAYITGKGQSIALDTTYEVIDRGTGWSMVKEIGSYARTGMYSDGINRFVSVSERGNGVYNYVIGKHSPYVRFNIEEIFRKLNETEGCKKDLWGGGDIIGGSPRVSGSKLTPEEVKNIIEEIIKNEA